MALPALRVPALPLHDLKALPGKVWAHLLNTAFGKRFLSPVNEFLVKMGIGKSASRFVLTVGDEGTTLVHVRNGEVVDALFVGPEAEDGPDTLREYMKTDPQSEVLAVSDVLEQMFREETLPKVGIMDRSTLLQRRLDLAFPNEPLRGSLSLPRKRGAPWNVVFAALPITPNLQKWVSFIEEIPNSIIGFGMLPLEVVDIVKLLAPSSAGETRRVWRALITEQASSGVRQIFEREGEFIVTRLTQKTSREMTAEQEAMLIERELRSSISYVKRLGFTDADRLDVVVLTSVEVGGAVSERDLPATSVTVLTPYQAGIAAGLGEVGREDSPFSDVLLALWVAAKRQLRIVLPPQKVRGRMQMAQAVQWATGGAVVGTLLTLIYAGSYVYDYFNLAETVQALNVDLPRARQALADERGRMASYPIPFDQLTLVAQNQETWSRNQVDPTLLFANLAKALTPTTRIDKMSFTQPLADSLLGTGAAQRPGARPAAGPRIAYEMRITVHFTDPDPQDPQHVLLESKDFLSRLNSSFPGYTTEISRLPVTLVPNSIFEGSVNGAAANGPAQQIPQTADYVIRKMAS